MGFALTIQEKMEVKDCSINNMNNKYAQYLGFTINFYNVFFII